MNMIADEYAVDRTASIVSAFVSNNSVRPSDLPDLISSTYSAIMNLSKPATPEPEPLVPAIDVKKSIGKDYIVCLDDGKRFKSLRRHIATLGMTPDQYREKWGLPSTYPMVAPDYSAKRANIAKENGLGRKVDASPEAPPVAPLDPPKEAAKAKAKEPAKVKEPAAKKVKEPAAKKVKEPAAKKLDEPKKVDEPAPLDDSKAALVV